MSSSIYRWWGATLLALAAALASPCVHAQQQQSPLARYLYATLLASTSPGGSVYSMEVMPECGTDPEHPTCPLEPVCEGASPLCAPPRWSAARGAWVRAETRETAAQRLRTAADAIVRTATYLTRCKDNYGRVVEECDPVRWPDGPRSLACALYGSSVWESGYREDIMAGYAPVGRGPDGEGCVMQVMPSESRGVASWLTDEQRRDMTDEQIVETLLGTDAVALEHCYEAGARILARSRSIARKCASAWPYAMYAAYGTGGRCAPRHVTPDVELLPNRIVDLTVPRKKNARPRDWAQDRASTYEKCMNRWPDKVASIPAWAESAPPAPTSQAVASAR